MWHIQDQVEKAGKSEKVVKCKNVRYFPIENQGSTDFGRLKFRCLRIIIKSDKKYELSISLNTARGIDFPGFTIKHPLNQFTGKCEQEKYDLVTHFERRLMELGGATLKDQIMELFIQRLTST